MAGEWMSAEHAISHVQAMTGGDRVRAQLELCHHAAQAGIETRGRKWTGDGFGEPESIPPARWENAYENGFAAAFPRVGDFRQQLEFRRADLLTLYPIFPEPNKRPKGTGYQKADALIHEKMRTLINERKARSPSDAAIRFLSEAHGASDEFKKARLVKGYKAKYGD
jgi:hypothetical protein